MSRRRISILCINCEFFFFFFFVSFFGLSYHTSIGDEVGERLGSERVNEILMSGSHVVTAQRPPLE